MKKNFLLKALATTALGLVLTTTAALAQAPGSGGPTPGSTPPDPTQVPIDGGASLLLASGVALGLKKLRDRRKAR